MRVDPNSFGFLVADVNRLIRAEIDRAIVSAGIGLTPAEARTLAHAARAGKVRQLVLADRMGLEAMTLSAYLDRLETQGLISREPDPADRRAKLIALTADADAVLHQLAAISASVRKAASVGIAAETWQLLIESLVQVRENLSATRDNASTAGDGR